MWNARITDREADQAQSEHADGYDHDFEFTDDDEDDDNERCEVHEGTERGDRCPKLATRSVYEPWTPASFEVRCGRQRITSPMGRDGKDDYPSLV